MSLARFGFTPTEGRVYAALLRLGTSTGYAVARELGIARANVYQALDSLVRRGAARRSATIPAQYAALAPAALVSELRRSVQRNFDELEQALLVLPRAGAAAEKEAGLEVITRSDRLVERAAECADGARSELLAVTGTWAGSLNAAVEGAGARGVSVKAVALADPAPQGAQLRRVSEAELREYWGGLPVAVEADRRRAVIGIITDREAASGLVTSLIGLVPFVRHLLRREAAGWPAGGSP